MNLHHRFRPAVLAALTSTALWAGVASAQFPAGFITGFEPAGTPTEPVGYAIGSVLGQEGWTGGTVAPRVQTAAEISAELSAAGLNPANPVHSGDQALLAVKGSTATESTGYFVRNIFFGLEEETDVIVDNWARPLTSGLGANPAGTPAGNDKTIGERQGNTFVGIMDTAEVRAAAVRFGVVTNGTGDPYTNVVTRTIDFASASAGAAVWVPSGLTWTADAWYNFKFDLDYDAKTYDFYVNDVKANATPIRFYTETSLAATRFFVSRGTNQAGQIIDDISVTAQTFSPGDFDRDGVVDGFDFLLWQQDSSVGSLDDWKANFGAGAVAATTSAIPEPAGIAMALSTLLLCVVGWARRRLSAPMFAKAAAS